MSTPKISVIVPLYNQGRFLADCLQSLQAQTHADWEAIVVNDGSTDHSLAVAERLGAGDARIRVVSKANGGLSSARNHGLDLARGEFIQFLDADDMLLPEKFARQLAQLANAPRASISVCRCRFGKYERMHEEPQPPLPFGLTHETTIEKFIEGWEASISIPCHSFLFDAVLFSQGRLRFDPRLKNHEDFECWVRLLNLRPVIFVLDECLAIYRAHPGGMSRDLGAMRTGFLAAVDLLLANPALSKRAHRRLRAKRRDIIRVYDRRMGLSRPPFPFAHFPRLRITIGNWRNKITRRLLGRVQHW